MRKVEPDAIISDVNLTTKVKLFRRKHYQIVSSRSACRTALNPVKTRSSYDKIILASIVFVIIVTSCQNEAPRITEIITPISYVLDNGDSIKLRGVVEFGNSYPLSAHAQELVNRLPVKVSKRQKYNGEKFTLAYLKYPTDGIRIRRYNQDLGEVLVSIGMVRADSLNHPMRKQYLRKENEAKESWSGWWAVPHILWSQETGLLHKSPYGRMKLIDNPSELKDTSSIILPGLELFLQNWKARLINNKFTDEVVIEISDTIVIIEELELLKIVNTCGNSEIWTIYFIHGDKFIEYLPPAVACGDSLLLKLTPEVLRKIRMHRRQKRP